MTLRRHEVLGWALLLTACGGGSPEPDAGPPPPPDAMIDGATAPDAAEDDGSMPPPDGGGGPDSGPADAGPPPMTRILLPADGSEVLASVAARVDGPSEIARVEVSVVGMPALSCTATERRFECLLDVTPVDPGPFTVRAVAFDDGGAEVGRDEVSLTRRAVDDPCAGVAGDAIDCVLARAADGTSAGFEGVSYLDYDDGHARLNTSRMTGIDARQLADVPMTPPAGVEVGIGNESRACSVSGGWLSRPRCDSANKAYGHYGANVFVMWPEHRDHGMRDYYQWQAPFFDLSQGSSGTELDEIQKLVLALAILDPEVRDALRSESAVAPAMAMLLRRSRVDTDLAYLEQEAHVTALGNLDNTAAMLSLAAAIRPGELPPRARVTEVSQSFPASWAMDMALRSDVALGYAPPTTPASDPDGRFEVVVDLSSSADPEDDELVFFPALLRGDPADVVIERRNVAGTRWAIQGSYPADRTILTGGYDRVVSRITVGFFAHDGLWVGTPAYVSIGGRSPFEPAPNSNDLD